MSERSTARSHLDRVHLSPLIRRVCGAAFAARDAGAEALDERRDLNVLEVPVGSGQTERVRTKLGLGRSKRGYIQGPTREAARCEAATQTTLTQRFRRRPGAGRPAPGTRRPPCHRRWPPRSGSSSGQFWGLETDDVPSSVDTFSKANPRLVLLDVGHYITGMIIYVEN